MQQSEKSTRHQFRGDGEALGGIPGEVSKDEVRLL
jgi:hypothetical protein